MTRASSRLRLTRRQLEKLFQLELTDGPTIGPLLAFEAYLAMARYKPEAAPPSEPPVVSSEPEPAPPSEPELTTVDLPIIPPAPVQPVVKHDKIQPLRKRLEAVWRGIAGIFKRRSS